MSNVGTGTAGVGLGALAIIPLVAIGAVVGAGVLCYKGIMYCGNQLDKLYEQKRNEIAVQKAAVAHAQLARVDTAQQYFRVEQRLMAAHAARLDLVAPPPEKVAEANVSARTFIGGGRANTETLAQMENMYLCERLESEIRIGKGKLPDDLMARARQSLTGSSPTIQNMLTEIDSAWKRAAVQRNDQQYERPQLDLRLREMRAWLAGIRASIVDQHEVDPATYTSQLERIHQHIDEAEQLPTAAAMGKLAPIEDELDAVADALALDVRSVRDRVAAAVAPLSAQVETLGTILKDAGDKVSGLLLPEQIEELSSGLSKLSARAEQVQATGTMKQVSDLANDVANQERRIFDLIKTTQQQRLTAVIETTLAEQGFGQDKAAKPGSGDVMRVRGTRQQYTSEGAADQRRVTFEVTRECAISYDFSGYVGDTCLKDAQRIFEALAKKGIYILSDEDMRRLQEQDEITPSTLEATVVKPVVNKKQAILSSKILEVLDAMGYEIINREAIGDTVYFDASHDGLGFYSVSVDGKGDAHIFTDKDHAHQITSYSDEELLRQLASGGPGEDEAETPSPTRNPTRERQTE